MVSRPLCKKISICALERIDLLFIGHETAWGISHACSVSHFASSHVVDLFVLFHLTMWVHVWPKCIIGVFDIKVMSPLNSNKSFFLLRFSGLLPVKRNM